jgi:integrase
MGTGSGRSGTQRNLQRTFPTLREAEAWLVDRKRQKREGSLSSLDRTLGSYIDEYEEELESGRAKARSGQPLKPGSVREYRKAVGILRAEASDLLARPVDLVTPSEIQAAVDHLSRTRAERTVEKVITPLRTIFNRLERLGIIGSSPMSRIVVPKDAPRIEPLDEVDPRAAYRIVQTLPPRERAFLGACLLAGLRPAEVQALRWSDIDLERSVINVVRNLSAGEFTVPKTEGSIRRAPVAESLADEIRAWKEVVAATQPKEWLGDDSLVFAKQGDPLSPIDVHTITAHARRRVREEDWKIIQPRNCRHIYVSALQAGGVDLVESMRSTGHTSPKVHLDTYARQVAGRSEKTRTAVEEVFGKRLLSHDEAEDEAWQAWHEQLDVENRNLFGAAEAQGGGYTPRTQPRERPIPL